MYLRSKILIVVLILFVITAGTRVENHFNEPTTKVMLFKWKTTVKKEHKQKIIQLFTSLSQEVNGFNQFETKEIKSDRFDVACFLTFTTVQAMEDYKNHELHRQIVELGPTLIEDFLEFEYSPSVKQD